MKKRIIICLLVCILLSGCMGRHPSGMEITESLPETAAEVFTYVYQADSEDGAGLFGEGVSYGSWSAEGKGYFILDLRYYDGEVEGLQIRMNNPKNKTLCIVPTPPISGLYASESMKLESGSDYVIWFDRAEDLKADITIYFVPA